MIKAGFYPAGGGRFVITIDPAPRLARLELLDRGEILERRVTAKSANLPAHIAEREVAAALRFMNWPETCGTIDAVPDAPGPGNLVLVEIESEHVTEICTGFGEIGTSAEGVAERAAKEARRYLAAGVPVGAYLADQLLPVLALGSGGSFRTLTLSRHFVTNADVLRQFADVRIETVNESRDMTRVNVDVN